MGDLIGRFEKNVFATAAEMECCAGITKRLARAELPPLTSGGYAPGPAFRFAALDGMKNRIGFLEGDYDPHGFSIPQF